jgi:hypothetical protein
MMRHRHCRSAIVHYSIGSLFVAVAMLVAGPAMALEFDPGLYSQEVTECDRQASHKDDPFHVLPGLSSSQMNLEAAIAACLADVERDPENPRLRYQLARSLGYSGRGSEATPHREAAVAANYPQALFVVGYLHLYGLNGARQDTCRAAELIRRAAQYGRLAGQVGFPRYVLAGRFDGCEVRKDTDEMRSFLEDAADSTGDYYQGLLIEMLLEDLNAAS